VRAKINLRGRIARSVAGVALVAVLSGLAISRPADTHANTAVRQSDAAPSADQVAHHTRVRISVDAHRSRVKPGDAVRISGRITAPKPHHVADAAGAAAAVARQATSRTRVKLQMRYRGHWVLAQHRRTNRHGRFTFAFHVRRTGIKQLRVLYVRNAIAHAKTARAGRIVSRRPLIPVVASWYYDAGDTACGFHARYGVANKTLPCGTKVRIAYGGRSVVATVDDRGPYIAGRTYDLNQNVSRALGMNGVATVHASIG
jgi:rare lipoprotein A